MYIYPPLRKQLLPDIEQVTEALRKADEPDPNGRDVRPLMSMEMRIAEACPRLAGDLQTRRTAVSSYDWDIVAREPGQPAEVERAKRAKLRLARSISYLMDYYADRSVYGGLVCETAWDPTGVYGTTPRILQRLKPVEFETTSHEARAINVLIDASMNITRLPLQNEPPENWLVDQDDAFVRGGIVRSLIFHQVLINEQIQEWASTNRKLKGMLEMKWKQWATDKDKEVAIAAMKALAKNNFAAMSDALQTVFTQVADAAAGGSFEKFKQELQADSSIRVLGQANTQELPAGGGSRAALEVQAKIGMDVHWSTIKSLYRFINEQLVLFDFRMNGNPLADIAPYEFQVKLADELDREREARVAAELNELGVPVPLEQVLKNTGIRAAEEGELVIQGGQLVPYVKPGTVPAGGAIIS